MSTFLGPRGQATVILFSSHFDHELPKLRELKRMLKIPDGKFYKSKGYHNRWIDQLESLLTKLRQARAPESDQIRRVSSTDFLVTVPDVAPNLFLTMKYSAELIGGFNLTDQSMVVLGDLLRAYDSATYVHQTPERIVSWLESNMTTRLAGAQDDQTVLQPDLDGIKRLLAGYGDANLEAAIKGLEDWHEQYRWQDRPKAPSDQDQAVDQSQGVAEAQTV
jgi:hypothetical protein